MHPYPTVNSTTSPLALHQGEGNSIEQTKYVHPSTLYIFTADPHPHPTPGRPKQRKAANSNAMKLQPYNHSSRKVSLVCEGFHLPRPFSHNVPPRSRRTTGLHTTSGPTSNTAQPHTHVNSLYCNHNLDGASPFSKPSSWRRKSSASDFSSAIPGIPH